MTNICKNPAVRIAAGIIVALFIAIVASSLPGTDPVKMISIVPRGIAALGYTMQTPTEDRFLINKSELLNRISALLGGRAAEENIFEDISTGLHNDLARATGIARSMVKE